MRPSSWLYRGLQQIIKRRKVRHFVIIRNSGLCKEVKNVFCLLNIAARRNGLPSNFPHYTLFCKYSREKKTIYFIYKFRKATK